MSTPNWVDGGRLAPPPISRTPVRNSQNGTQTTIMIEPTPKYQQFYNTTRREMDRQRLEYHVAEENSLELPKAQSMSRSTTSDSLPSPSICNCHDFSKLEAAYLESLVDEGQRTKASRGRAVRPFGELGTFGAGGAGGSATATIPSYLNFDFDLSDLPAGHEPPPEVHANLRPALDFDIQSKASVTAIVTAPRESPFYLGLPPHVPIPAEFAIGSSMPFRNRWECRYQHTTEDTRSLASMSACAWTGPFEELHNHFATQHHPFRLAEGAHRSICSGCEAASLNWVDERACIEPEKCLPDDWQKWLFGAPVSQSKPLPPPRLAMSEASGSRSSWLNPAWNMTTPGSSNTERSNLPYGSYTNNSGFHKHFTSGYENSEANDGEENNEAYPELASIVEMEKRIHIRPLRSSPKPTVPLEAMAAPGPLPADTAGCLSPPRESFTYLSKGRFSGVLYDYLLPRMVYRVDHPRIIGSRDCDGMVYMFWLPRSDGCLSLFTTVSHFARDIGRENNTEVDNGLTYLSYLNLPRTGI
ncbi:hypothetical protein CHU98_g4492 [Xylaria longipes]|nr:hypothetical protein CHU98_g4492 [Xylaria longipes]